MRPEHPDIISAFLATSEPTPTVAPANAQAGASQAAGDGELPMLVWLRGDEDLCAEFCLDAENVMQQLGIRRSRLTQISGRELRVGRMRRGRYISPVYRQADVDAYLAWTRASASHQKSSGLMQDAAEELMQQSERLSERLETVPQELAAEVRISVREAARAQTRTTIETGDQLKAEIAWLAGEIVGSEQRLLQSLARQREFAAMTAAKLQTQAAQVELLTRQLAELAGLGRLHKTGMDEILKILATLTHQVLEVSAAEQAAAEQAALQVDLLADLRRALAARNSPTQRQPTANRRPAGLPRPTQAPRTQLTAAAVRAKIRARPRP